MTDGRSAGSVRGADMEIRWWSDAGVYRKDDGGVVEWPTDKGNKRWKVGERTREIKGEGAEWRRR